MKIKNIIVVFVLLHVLTLSMYAATQRNATTDSTKKYKVNTYLRSLYNPSTDHSLLISGREIIFVEALFYDKLKDGVVTGCKTGCELSKFNIVSEDIERYLSMLYEFERKQGYISDSYDSWVETSGIPSVDTLKAELGRVFDKVKFDDTNGTYTITVTIKDHISNISNIKAVVDQATGTQSVSLTIYAPYFAYNISVDFNTPVASSNTFTVSDYTCTIASQDCVQNGSQIGDHNLTLHTKVIMEANQADGSIISTSGRLYYLLSLSSYWDNQNEMMLSLSDDSNITDGDYVTIGSGANEFNVEW
ncbi:hypothetical protein MNB_ARC-1_159 [hydrothermal vent metagenome]|uniref:Uncharacterized protein n=1 Tax=hydrothermal vent metagenome TaxID=652676 RepID=A0A3B1E908_9ZZZZ